MLPVTPTSPWQTARCLDLQTHGPHLGVAEAIRLANALDLPTEGLKDAMRANCRLGRMAESFFSLHHLPESAIEDRSILPMRRTSGVIIVKSLELMRPVSERHGVSLPGRDLAEARFLRTHLLPDESSETCDNG